MDNNKGSSYSKSERKKNKQKNMIKKRMKSKANGNTNHTLAHRENLSPSEQNCKSYSNSKACWQLPVLVLS